MNILIVDDIYINRKILSQQLQSVGMNVFEATNGMEAIMVFENNPVDLIFMDIEMPVMNGLETAKYIKESIIKNDRKVKIIALTAYNVSINGEDLNLSNFDGLLIKPYSLEKLLQIINSQ